MVIGITGGIGAGKSRVLALLQQEYGAAALAADAIGHMLMEPGQACYPSIAEEFGQALLPDGRIDRQLLASLVFSDPNRLDRLNQIIHPAVKSFIREEILRLQAETPGRLIVIEAALLIEDHYEEICEEIWYIYADEQVRRERLRRSRGYSDARISAVMKNQLSDAEFRKCCRRVIDNSGSLEQTREELKKALEIERISWYPFS